MFHLTRLSTGRAVIGLNLMSDKTPEATDHSLDKQS